MRKFLIRKKAVEFVCRILVNFMWRKYNPFQTRCENLPGVGLKKELYSCLTSHDQQV